MNNYVEEMPIVHSTCYVPQLDLPHNRMNLKYRGPYREIIEFRNSLDFPVTVVSRNGFRHSIKGIKASNDQKAFVVRSTYIFEVGYHDDVEAWGNSLPQDATALQRKIYSEYLRIREYQALRQQRDVQVTIDKEIITSNMGNDFTVFNSEDDIVITTRAIRHAPAHPSQANRYPGDDWSNFVKPYITDNASSVRVEIVDNNYNVGKRFIFLAGECLDVVPVRDATRPEGVYITTNKSDPNNPSVKPVRLTKHFTLADAQEQLGLASDRESARYGGDPKLMTKRQIEQLEQSNILLRQQFANEKIELDRQKNELDRQKVTLERETVRAVHELDMLKHDMKKVEQERQSAISDLENARKLNVLEIERLAAQAALERDAIREGYEREKFIRTEMGEEAKHYRAEKSDRSKYRTDLIKFLSTGIISMVAIIGPLTKLWLMFRTETKE